MHADLAVVKAPQHAHEGFMRLRTEDVGGSRPRSLEEEVPGPLWLRLADQASLPHFPAGQRLEGRDIRGDDVSPRRLHEGQLRTEFILVPHVILVGECDVGAVGDVRHEKVEEVARHAGRTVALGRTVIRGSAAARASTCSRVPSLDASSDTTRRTSTPTWASNGAPVRRATPRPRPSRCRWP